ncbi:unnamed protein product, partial [Ectocarpus sp. 12 AP-2014]
SRQSHTHTHTQASRFRISVRVNPLIIPENGRKLEPQQLPREKTDREIRKGPTQKCHPSTAEHQLFVHQHSGFANPILSRELPGTGSVDSIPPPDRIHKHPCTLGADTGEARGNNRVIKSRCVATKYRSISR